MLFRSPHCDESDDTWVPTDWTKVCATLTSAPSTTCMACQRRCVVGVPGWRWRTAIGRLGFRTVVTAAN